MRQIFLLLAGIAAGAAPAAAQAWDAPTFLSTRPGDDIGAYFFDPDGGDWGVSGIWRQTGNLGLGLRVGVADIGDDNVFLVGSEFFGMLATAGAASPVDISWMVGFGAAFSHGTSARIPVGVGFGLPLGSARARLLPYVMPRAAVHIIAPDEGDSDTDVDLTVDVGADLVLGSVTIRGGLSLGEPESVGIGIAFPFGRRAVVR